MRRNLLFGMLVVGVFALRLWAQGDVGGVGWQPAYNTLDPMSLELARFMIVAPLCGLIFGAIRVAQTNARAQQAFATKLLGL